MKFSFKEKSVFLKGSMVGLVNEEINIDFFIKQLPDIAYISDKDSCFSSSNNTTAKILGYKSSDHLLGVHYKEMRCSAVELWEEFEREDQEVLQSKKKLKLIAHLYYANSEKKIVVGSKSPIFLKDGSIAGVFCYCTDITYANMINLNKLMDEEALYFHGASSQFVYFIDEKYKIDGIDLTERESECLFFLLRGKTAKGIAKSLFLSQRTVEGYIEKLKDKLLCSSTPQLREKAISIGLMNMIPTNIFDYLKRTS